MARILIVDDSSFMRSALKYIVEMDKHQVVGMAANGKEALALYTKEKPDLVTMDILMAEMDGLSAVQQIRKFDKNAKIIMVTAIGQEESQETAKLMGASGYIRKPFKEETIISEISRVLANEQS